MKIESRWLVLLLALTVMALFCLFACSSGGGDDDDNVPDDDAGDDDGDDDVDDNTDDDVVVGEGEWLDEATGLIWQQDPVNEWILWDEAQHYCDNLILGDHDNWRLPTISELRSLIRGCDETVTGGACNVTDECTEKSCRNDSCKACQLDHGPNNQCYLIDELSSECGVYWSDTSVSDETIYVWLVDFEAGQIYGSYNVQMDEHYVRCVR